MVELMRVDHRLLHGQVAFSWTQSLGVDCILIANDDVPVNELRKTTIKLAKPQGVKLVIKNIADAITALNSGVTDKYNLFIIVESVEDAYQLAVNVEQIKSINLGGTKPKEGTEKISKAIHVTKEERQMLDKLISLGKQIEIRQVPTDKTQLYKDVK